ncbi:hypothetical protein LTR37_004118 [Vermiconidia calcicola]|uniref:Uncharacterized protein n=1 Tax=Vermiconidia calcicola TaxID=1690605 RepID=A0ACC3NR13_9PEZI|nr:hypothetical protein LTR37_004118 [Vermiconidia calcicola]
MTNFEETLAQGVKEGNIPHAVVAATNKDGSFTYKHAIGYSVLGNEEPIKDDAEFLLASQTKLLATIAALQIVESGKFGLDDDVASVLPELAEQQILKGFNEQDEPILEKRKNAITLRHLLTHSCGMAYDAADPLLIKFQQQRGHVPNSGVTVADRFSYPLVFEPGTSWLYGPGIDWAGKLVERVVGQRLEEYMQKNMWEPLGVKSITFYPYENPELSSKVPALTTRSPDGKLVLHTDAFLNTGSVDCFGGHGAYATMGDYLKVLQSILANDGKLLKPETVEMMFTPQLPPDVKNALSAFRQGPYAAMLIGENDSKIDADWGIGGILLLEDDVGRRKKGTLNWGGMANCFWIIDREADLALTFGTQVLPPGDPPTGQMITAVEVGVYEKAGVKF